MLGCHDIITMYGLEVTCCRNCHDDLLEIDSDMYYIEDLPDQETACVCCTVLTAYTEFIQKDQELDPDFDKY